jgi:hypothetical protein
MNGFARSWIAVAMLVPLTVACNPAPNPIPEQPAGPMPAKVCEEARQGLEALTGSGMFTYTAAGEATLDRETWLTMDQGQRDGLGQALAFHAACQAKEAPREQQYVIRDETGTSLAQQVVETTPDFGSLGR